MTACPTTRTTPTPLGVATSRFPGAAVERADGYEVCLFDGNSYARSARRGRSATTWWSTQGRRLAPGRQDVAGQPTRLAPGAAMGNPSTAPRPTDAPLIDPGGQPPELAGNAGVLASDGSDLFARARGGQSDGTRRWHRYSAVDGSHLD